MKAVRILLDNTLEIVILVLRVFAGAGAGASFGLSTAAIWKTAYWPELIGTAAVVLAATLAAGYLGFYVFGNEEWRRGKTEDRGAEVRHD